MGLYFLRFIQFHINVSQTLPTDLWVKILEERLKLFDCVKKGWVMEGFPQTREQAIAMQAAGISPKHCGMLKRLAFKGIVIF